MGSLDPADQKRYQVEVMITSPRNFLRVMAQVLARLLAISIVIGVTGCSRESSPSTEVPWKMTAEASRSLEIAIHLRVLFAHQSVGANILEGVRRLLDEKGGDWPLADLDAGKPTHGAGIIQAWPGKNGDPKSKMDGFLTALDSLPGEPVQIALVKLCYVDFSADSDVLELFEYYKRTVAKAKAAHPNVLIAHATVPLWKREQGLAKRLKRLVGLQPGSDLLNAKREEYNRLLRAEFPSELVFDIARAESTRADGSRELYPIGGQSIPALVAEYTSDGGHLNKLGMQVVAAEFVRFLAAQKEHP